MENVLIRDAVFNDLPILLRFEQELIKAERPFDPTIADDPISYYSVEDYISNDKVKLVVAEAGGRVVSSGYALQKQARTYLDHKYYGYLGFMYTMTDFRGKGINKKIVDELVKWCQNLGLKEVRLTVYDENLPAIKAYEKAGFKKHLCEMRIA
ncbi:GNAT family N-acetyltransferase [Croceitalea rosinachiae]|uniref:GNAT family N-acetyltransferase n=1 Tax=Croceitalea rosinachiae TaxID=3075596 RepID=A0ABU3AEJ1_9FLAO|nr:GNAT family N-acetyltransferase [Croceitalea sp. F388]MDT0608605.1 GNAT family N-acetyltransferase [Croceitalea sp. F388]